jgi:hypothetical protein
MVYGIDRELYSPLIITLFPTVIERELKSVTLYNNIDINKWNQPHINHDHRIVHTVFFLATKLLLLMQSVSAQDKHRLGKRNYNTKAPFIGEIPMKKPKTEIIYSF